MGKMYFDYKQNIERQYIERVAGEKTKEDHFSKCLMIFVFFLVTMIFSMIFYVESVEDRMGKMKIEIRSLQSEIKYFQRALNLEEADK
jgi:cell division protein FtsL